MSDKYYNDTEYYKRLNELVSGKNLYTFSIQGRRVSEEEFYKHLQKVANKEKTNADTV